MYMLAGILFLSLAFTGSFSSFVNEGETCELPYPKTKYGICRRDSDCEKTQRRRPRCGFSNFTELTCCRPTTHLARLACTEYKEYASVKSAYAISYGAEAKLGEFPHMVGVGYELKNILPWQCGGTLISNFYVLTAAHCITDFPVLPSMLRVGDADLQSDINDDEAKTYYIEEIILHPNYEPSKAIYNDIALLKSKEEIKFGDFVYPACLFRTGSLPISTFSVIGYGTTEFNNKNRMEVSQPLRVASAVIVSKKDCLKSFDNVTQQQKFKKGLIGSQICAGPSSNKPRSGTCEGDSGGPLHFSSGKMFFVVGITSFGRTCGGNDPGIYTNVKSYVPWIETFVWGGRNPKV